MSSFSGSGFFGPLMNGPYGDQNIRVSDAERQAIADRLAVHYGDGRLDQAEFDGRVGQAMTAKTRGDLRGLLDDLPEPGAAGPLGAFGPGSSLGPAEPAGPVQGRGGRRHPVLFVAMIVFVILIAAHTMWWFAVPGLWLGLILIAAVAVAGRSRR